MNRKISILAFVLGLLAVLWVAAGYVGSGVLALLMTLLIAGVYLVGAMELYRFSLASGALNAALSAIPENLDRLQGWLDTIPAGLQSAVRQRVEGERVNLPGPAMTPYLVGLLVLLGMLGTFLGMVVTLNGAVIALESTTDLQTIRGALAAPVKGLGVAFGTSVAGVAASAMLGLVSALCRRERLQVVQLLDAKIVTELQRFSLAFARQETFRVAQAQAQALPAVVDKLQLLIEQMAQHSQAGNDRLLSSQEKFQANAQSAYTTLAASVDQSLKSSLAEAARMAGETLQPVAQATMQGIATEASALHGKLAETVSTHLEGLSARFGSTAETLADSWNAALAKHDQSATQLNQGLQETLGSFVESFQQRSTAMLATVDQAHAALRDELAATAGRIARETRDSHQDLLSRFDTQFAAVADRLVAASASSGESWTAAMNGLEASQQQLLTRQQQASEALVASLDQRTAALIDQFSDAQRALQTASAAQDRERLDAISGSISDMLAMLRHEWQQAGERSLMHQERICEVLESTATTMSATAREQASNTVAEVTRLMQTAAEAPKAAADLVGQLRQELSASMARDNAMLEERSRIMETLASLLDAINHASTEQRQAIDDVVASSASLLDRVDAQFSARIESESARMVDAATQVASGAVEVASLGEAFAHSMQLFAESSDKLMGTLKGIEASLGKSMVRSDEQLAYTVAQARELIDLSVLSQKRMIEEMRQISGRPAELAYEAS